MWILVPMVPVKVSSFILYTSEASTTFTTTTTMESKRLQSGDLDSHSHQILFYCPFISFCHVDKLFGVIPSYIGKLTLLTNLELCKFVCSTRRGCALMETLVVLIPYVRLPPLHRQNYFQFF